jgi:hypothetical protein
MGPKGALDTKTDRPTDRNINSAQLKTIVCCDAIQKLLLNNGLKCNLPNYVETFERLHMATV